MPAGTLKSKLAGKTQLPMSFISFHPLKKVFDFGLLGASRGKVIGPGIVFGQINSGHSDDQNNRDLFY